MPAEDDVRPPDCGFDVDDVLPSAPPTKLFNEGSLSPDGSSPAAMPVDEDVRPPDCGLDVDAVLPSDRCVKLFEEELLSPDGSCPAALLPGVSVRPPVGFEVDDVFLSAPPEVFEDDVLSPDCIPVLSGEFDCPLGAADSTDAPLRFAAVVASLSAALDGSAAHAAPPPIVMAAAIAAYIVFLTI